MKSWTSRILAISALVTLGGVLLASAARTASSILEPDKLIILSTTDLKGKTSPCG